jgi:uncharacterized protein (TIGR00251 family)
MSLSDPLPCTVTGSGIVLNVHLQPRASKNEVCGVHGDALKIRLTAPPVDGAANKLCREFLAGLFGVPKSAVEIISGDTSRHKRVRIAGGDPVRLRQILHGSGVGPAVA